MIFLFMHAKLKFNIIYAAEDVISLQKSFVRYKENRKLRRKSNTQIIYFV